jgi:hypothetical protein
MSEALRKIAEQTGFGKETLTLGGRNRKDHNVRNGAETIYRAVTRFRRRYYFGMKIRDLAKDQLLSVPCPTCGAAIKERCELNTGDPRNEPHRARKLIAADAVERSPRSSLAHRNPRL